MSRILITGMTAAQVSPAYSSISFSSLLTRKLEALGHSVVREDPSVSWTAESLSWFDTVFVGVAPVTALGANRAYGALSVISVLWGTPRLRLFIEAPNPGQISHSITSILKTPDNINKAFYSYRKEYDALSDHSVKLRVYQGVLKLGTREWPNTIYPTLPWTQEDPAVLLPEGCHYCTPLSMDMSLLTDDPRADYFSSPPDNETWVADDPRSKWTIANTDQLVSTVEPMKLHKFSTDEDVYARIYKSLGALISPTRHGRTWWTPRYGQALRAGVPVATEWRDAGSLGAEWSLLPTQIESMSLDEQVTVATMQFDQYLNALPSEESTRDALETFLS